MNKTYIATTILICTLITFFLTTHGPIGSDSYAFVSYACGQSELLVHLNTVWSFYPCGTIGIIIFNLIATLIILFSLYYILSKHTNLDMKYYLFVIFGAIPLFFLEFLRYENDLMGYALGFFAVCVFEWSLNNKKWVGTIIAFLILILSVQFWKASIILAIIPLALRYKKENKTHKIIAFLTLASLGIYFYFIYNQIYIFSSVNGETLPVIGFIFLLPLIIFWKQVPKNIQPLSAFFICIGIIQFKFAYFAVPWLATGLTNYLNKNEKQKKIIVATLFLLILIYTFLLFPNQFPTQQDEALADQAIKYSKSNQLPLYWSYDYKWLMVNKNKPMIDTNFSAHTDWNRPFTAILRSDQLLDKCEIINLSSNGLLVYYFTVCN